MRLIKEFREKHQRTIHAIGLVFAIGLQTLLAFGLPIPQGTATLITLSIISYVLFDISSNTSTISRNKVYEEQADKYVDVEKYIDEKGAKKAIVIQYSGKMAISGIRKLITKGADVTLYIKNPDIHPISEMQMKRIVDTVLGLPGEIKVNHSASLTIYDYDPPASMRGISIDDKLLALGWYTHENAIRIDPNYPNDRFELSGHDIAGMLLYAGTPEHHAFHRMFMNLVQNYDNHIKLKKKKPRLKLPLRPNHKRGER